MNNKQFKIFVINYFGNLPKVLEDIDIKPHHNGLMFCPMHDNYNTPAAKLFKDKTGWHFYCFTENRQFGTYDVYKDVYNLNMNRVFDYLWNQLTESDKTKLIDLFGEFDDSAPVENIEVYQKFRNREINYQQLKNFLVDQITNEN